MIFRILRPGETYSQLLEEMIENEKKVQLLIHLKKIADDGEFVELKALILRTRCNKFILLY